MGAAIVIPVRYVSEGLAMQTTSREVTALGISIRSLAPPRVGARVSMALYLPERTVPEVAIGRVARARRDAPAESGFWADFLVLDPEGRRRITQLLAASGSTDNSRACERRRVQLTVSLRTDDDFVEQHATNLSRGGIFIACESPPERDTVVEVLLRLPDSPEAISTAGLVVHRVVPGKGGAAGVGVQFIDSTDAFRVRLDRYLNSL